MATVSSFAELVYSHFIKKMTYSMEIEINDFKGAALMNIQPVLMELLTNRPEWEAVIRDKTIRYYHLQRPIDPRRFHPRLTVPKRKQLGTIKYDTEPSSIYFELIQIGLTQWSYARTIEHIEDLLKAAAMINAKKTVTTEDMEVVKHIIEPMMLERWLFKKYAFESHIHFDDDGMCILTELASFPKVSINQVCTDFKVTPQTCYSLLKNVDQWAFRKNDGIEPTDLACEILEEVGHKLEICEERKTKKEEEKRMNEEMLESEAINELIEEITDEVVNEK